MKKENHETKIHCPICNFKVNLFCKAEESEIFKCVNCGFGFTKNLKNKIGDYHRDNIYIEEKNLFENIFQKRVKIISRYKKNGKALEIGCSTGLFLSLLKTKGWQVKGVEVSQKAAKLAIKKGINVEIAPFEKINFKDKFDLVILNHTLEHLDNPYQVVKKIKQILNKNGLIFIDLPNFDSFSVKIFREKWPMLLPDEHLWHFTNKSMDIFLNNLGFNIIYSENASGIWDFGNPIGEIFSALFNFKKRFINEALTALPSLLITKLGMGTGLTI